MANVITNEDIKIMEEFIKKYEQIENENKRYLQICESIRKNSLFQKYNDEETEYSMEEIFKIIENNESNQINKENDINRKFLLLAQLNELKKMIDQIQDYKKVEENYKQLYKIDTVEDIDEPPTKEYKKNEPLPQKEYPLNNSITITQIYKRIKELYTYYTRGKEQTTEENYNKNLKTYINYKEEIIKYLKNIKMETNNNKNNDNYEENYKIERIK